MNGSALQLALREMRRHFARPVVWVGVIGVGVLLGLAGPFGTLERVPWPVRMPYWLGVALGSYAIGAFLTILIEGVAARRCWPVALHLSLRTAAISLAVSGVLLALNAVLFGIGPDGPVEALVFLANVAAIGFVITLVSWLMDRDGPEAQAAPPPLLNRVRPARRGPLLSLSVQDHYVEITTRNGQEMVLMRLSDAIREAGAGVQIHRSHWVAEGSIADVRRRGDAARVVLTDGRELPVSRGRVADLKALGWLGGRG